MKLRIYDWRFRHRRLEALYVEDPDSVRALRPHIEREEPLWAEAVRRGWELYRDAERVSLETRVPLQAVIAILENLRERGELPAEDRESKI